MIGIRDLLNRYMLGDTLPDDDMRVLAASKLLTPFETKVRMAHMEGKKSPVMRTAIRIKRREADDTHSLLVDTAEWMPSSVVEHTPDFVAWINSMLYGRFIEKIYYKPYDLYVRQAEAWLQDTTSVLDFESYDARMDWACKEWDRCHDNTLYTCCKYGYLHEGSSISGRRKFVPYEHQRVLLYLFDCGYSFMLGKGRQIGSSSLIGMASLFKIVFNRNAYLKFITENEKTGEEIFNDKIKYPYNELPLLLRPTVQSDSSKKFWLSSKKGKGSKGYPNSRIEVVPPSSTAVNGGSPQIILIDEIGNIGMLGDMIREGLPTLYWKNPDTGKFERKRQMVCWGTSGAMTRGKGEYQQVWTSLLSLWEEGDFSSGMVPLFFDWTTRLTQDEYDTQKKIYYGGQRAKDMNIDLETSKVQFHQHYPSRWEDMFLSSLNTLVGKDVMSKGINVCRNLGMNERPVWGYMEPIYDLSCPYNTGDIPYRIIGSRFIPVTEEERPIKGTVLLRRLPDRKWRNRYYKGTDPISAATGKSKFSSTVYDAVENEPVAVLNHRTKDDPKSDFLQSLLLNLFYDKDNGTQFCRGIPELVESNIGQGYVDYTNERGFDYFVYNRELPLLYQGGTHVGFDNKTGSRNANLIALMQSIFRDYWEHIKIELYWIQLETFTEVLSPRGTSIWGPQNKRTHYDDCLFSLAYSKLCRDCFLDRSPEKQEYVESIPVTKFKLVRGDDMTLRRVKVTEYAHTTVEDNGSSIHNV